MLQLPERNGGSLGTHSTGGAAMIAHRKQRFDVRASEHQSVGAFVGGHFYPIRNARPAVELPRPEGKGTQLGRAGRGLVPGKVEMVTVATSRARNALAAMGVAL